MADQKQFAEIEITLNKKENGKFSPIGTQKIYCPTLEHIVAFVAAAEISKDEKGNDVYDEGLPVYTTAQANWVQGAMLAAVKAQARNKIIPETATVKDGLKIATNWEELTAVGVRDGSGLALARDFKEAFKEWVSKQGLSEAATSTLVTLVSNKAALALQTPATKAKVEARLGAFAESLSPDTLEKFMRPLEAATAACAESADPLEGL